MKLTEHLLSNMIRHNTHGGIDMQQKLIIQILQNQEKLEQIEAFGLLEHLDIIRQSYQIIGDEDGIRKTMKLKEILRGKEE